MVGEIIKDTRCCSTPTNTPTPADSHMYNKAILPHMVMHGNGNEEWSFTYSPESVPRNYKHIVDQLSKDRPSVTPELVTEDDFQAFRNANADAMHSDHVVQNVIRPFLEVTWDAKHMNAHCAFDNLALLSNSMPDVCPALFHGEPQDSLDPEVVANLYRLIVPAGPADNTAPIAPNFIVVVPEGDDDAAASGALSEIGCCAFLAARAMHALATYGEEQPFYSRDAYSIVTCFIDGLLTMWAAHADRPVDGCTEPSFHLTPVASVDMFSSLEEYRYALTIYRNLRDWASQKRRQAFERVNDSFI